MVVCGFISVESGKIMMKAFQRKSFTAKHILRFLKELSTKLKDKEVVAFGDNASIHKACREDVEGHCEMLFNLPYRPDLNNIESVWLLAKRKYRAEVARLLVTKQTINNLKLVKKILSEITDEQCSSAAAIGWKKLLNAEPIEYNNEEEQQLTDND